MRTQSAHRGPLRLVIGVLAPVAHNHPLRRVEVAFFGFRMCEVALWIAMLVYAYERGGATTAGLAAVVQLVPSAVFAPFAAAVADRRGPGRSLRLGYLAQSVAAASVAAALIMGSPSVVVYGLAALASSALTITRPAQAALLPWVARDQGELTAANALSGWVESAGSLAGPAAAGALLAAGGPGAVYAVMAIVVAGSAAFVATIAGPPPLPAADAGDRGRRRTDALVGFRRLCERRDTRIVSSLLGAQYVVIGAMDVLFVVLALDVLQLGDSGAGYLNAAFGAGGVAAVVLTTTLTGRRLAPALLLGVVVWSTAFVAIAVWPTTTSAFLLLAVAGAGRTVLDVAGRTLLQRLPAFDVMAQAFGAVEALAMAGLAAGSLLAPALVSAGDARLAFVGAALVLPLVVVATGRGLADVDARADMPVVEIALLRSLPMMACLPPPAIERLARGLSPRAATCGEAVIVEDEAADCFYVVGDGRLDVVKAGRHVSSLARGECFGEIALLEDERRTASVVARTDAVVFTLARPDFLAAMTGHPESQSHARRMADERLAELRTHDPP